MITSLSYNSWLQNQLLQGRQQQATMITSILALIGALQHQAYILVIILACQCLPYNSTHKMLWCRGNQAACMVTKTHLACTWQILTLYHGDQVAIAEDLKLCYTGLVWLGNDVQPPTSLQTKTCLQYVAHLSMYRHACMVDCKQAGMQASSLTQTVYVACWLINSKSQTSQCSWVAHIT